MPILLERKQSAGLICLATTVIFAVAAAMPVRQSSPTRFTPNQMNLGHADAGRDVFRFETFGNEGFWTDAARLPQGMKDAKFTPLDALRAGVSLDSDRLDEGTLKLVASELKTDLSIENAPILNDPATLDKLLMADAVIGLVSRHGKMGVTCALCHTITDCSIYSIQNGGGIGKRLDGRTQHNLNVGRLLAVAANSRAFFPILQLESSGKTIGRASVGLTKDSTEAEVDAYLNNPKYYPVGMFDDTPDGNGNPVHIQPLFRQDLAAPYGSSGQDAKLEDFNNAVYTVILDLSSIATPGGRGFLKALAGDAGAKISDDYKQVLRDTGVKRYPYIQAKTMGQPGAQETPVGKRVDSQKLLDLNAYLAGLPAPTGIRTDIASIDRGRKYFAANCTSCHGIDQSSPVPPILVPMKKIFPGYAPVLISRRKPPLSPIQNSPGTFDDKMIVVDASPLGKIRGDALPLLLDLARKPVFLHDDSVHGLGELLDPKRGRMAPHPFYVRDHPQRLDVVSFLKSLDTAR
jgi:hypothetical protein